MASKEESKSKGSKNAEVPALSKTLMESAGMDMTGFRVGKQRLVSKKKKNTPLKKLILAEREEHRNAAEGDKIADIDETGETESKPDQPNGNVDDDKDEKNKAAEENNEEKKEEDDLADKNDESKEKPADSSALVVDGLCLDAPEFVPSAWTATLEAQAASAKPGTESKPGVEGSEAAPSPETLPAAFEPPKRTGALSASTLEFVPSWHQDAEQTPAQWLNEEAPLADALERLRAPPASQQEGTGSKKKRKKKKKDGAEDAEGGAEKEKPPPQPKKEKAPPKNANIEVRHYVHQNLSEDLDTKVKEMLGELVRFQERAREKDPLKFAKLKRFCIGLREVTRAVQRGKARCLVCAPNLEVCETEGGLDDTVEDLVELCRDNDVPVIFALSRNRLGKALSKNIRLSCIAVLSAEGAHQQFKECIKLTEELRRQWVLQQMMAMGGPPPIEDPGDDEAAQSAGEEEEQHLKAWAEKYSAPPKVEEEKKLTRQEMYDLKKAEEEG
eukprot:gnl/MRDRNA2_/MRDRNA2_107621_c0_seq1.p1 gnl/MRDRNA2_/MRDRNA2_107621_c0~~gnl/MRDRNA2_/MRDRNA2_107621_c0_seq1.p1  ORF type:complete len:500 (+),score=189.35 gnl/MRDRNA2_/MRDRNA2_107621_c0_seq1:121-1620(+)